jgi:uncharacterized protein (TIGR02996 family)
MSQQQNTPFADLPRQRPEAAAFLAAAKEEPEDDAPRLVLCDWLQEHGDEHDAARADFVRLQCQFAREALRSPFVADILRREHILPYQGVLRYTLMGAYRRLAAQDARLGNLLRRAADLHQQHEARWLGPVRQRANACQSHRGLLTLDVDGRKFACRLMAAVAASDIGPWLEALHLSGVPREALGRIARCPLLAHLRTLDLSSNPGLGAEGLGVLVSSPHLSRLARLNASQTGLRGGGAQALARATGLSGLRELVLSGNGLGPADAEALATAPHLGGLTSLVLAGNRIGAAGVLTLADSPHLSNLAALNLSSTALGPEGGRALAASSGLARLTMLDLESNTLGPEGLAALLAWPGLERLTTLSLRNNGLGDAGAAALAASPRLANLETLTLTVNGVGPAGAEALAASPHLAGLKALTLSSNLIGPEGARALASSAHLAALTSLELWVRDVGEEGDKFLRERFGDRYRH